MTHPNVYFGPVPEGTAPHARLDDTRAALAGKVDDGADCPCCGQFVKVYRRPFGAVNARLLIAAVRAHGTDVFHAPTSLTSHAGGEWARLALWDLIASASPPARPSGTPARGWWRVTDLGVEVALRRQAIHRYALVYNGERLGHDGPAIHVGDALGDAFDLRDLLGSRLAKVLDDPDAAVALRDEGDQLTLDAVLAA